MKAVCVLSLATAIAISLQSVFFATFRAPREAEARGSCHVRGGARINCFPDFPSPENVSESDCLARDCCFRVADPSQGFPVCYRKVPGTNTLEVTEGNLTDGAMTVAFPEVSSLWPESDGSGSRRDWRYRARRLADGHVALRLWDEEFRGTDSLDMLWNRLGDDDDLGKENVLVEYAREGDDQRFSLKVEQRKFSEGREVIRRVLDATFGSLILNEGYTELTMMLPSDRVYGLLGSENWNRNAADTVYRKVLVYNVDASLGRGHQHSYANFIVEDGIGGYLGFLVDSANAPMQIEVMPGLAERNESIVVFRGTGGASLVCHIFLGPSPSDVITQQFGLARSQFERNARPHRPPLWSLGHHICRRTAKQEEDFLADAEESWSDLPSDSDCVGASVMKTAFETNGDYDIEGPDSHFEDLRRDVELLKAKGKKFVLHQPVQINAGLASEGDFFVCNAEGDIFVANFSNAFRRSETVQAIFPDFGNPELEEWYHSRTAELVYSLGNGSLDGLTLIKNSPLAEGNLCDLSDLPFVPRFEGTHASSASVKAFGVSSLCPDSLHHGATRHLYHHNNYPLRHAITARKCLSEDGQYLFTHYSAFGASIFGGVTGSEFDATWPNLRRSLREMLDLGLSGAPIASMKSCGIVSEFGATEVETDVLCLRWFQVAAFMPALHTEYSDRKELPLFNSRFKWILRALTNRMKLMPYIYTVARTSLDDGEPIVRPLFYEFPSESSLRIAGTFQFMFGGSILVSPVMYPGENLIRVHFPTSWEWYDLWSGARQGVKGFTLIESSMHQIRSHIRSGRIVPTLVKVNMSNEESYESSNFALIVALSCGNGTAVPFGLGCEAFGEMLLLEGSGTISFRVQPIPDGGHKLILHREGNCDLYKGKTFENVVIYGVESDPEAVFVNDSVNVTTKADYDEDYKRLQILDVGLGVCDELKWH